MIRFLLTRIGTILGTALVASFLVFAINEFSAGNVAKKILGPFSTAEQQEMLNKALKVDDPLPVRYVRWLGVLTGLAADPLAEPGSPFHRPNDGEARYFGNFGYSTLYKAPVNQVIWGRLANTALLAAVAFVLIVPISIVLGLVMGLRAGTAADRGLSALSIVFTSTPEFAAGVFLSVIFVVILQWLPGVSPLDPGAGWSIPAQLVLPVMTLVLVDVGYIARVVRQSVIDTSRQHFIRTATLKGISRRRVIWRHILPNAMIAPFTIILLQINWLITGVVVTEAVFGYPGFGRMLLDAALFGDVTLVETSALVALAIAIITQVLSDIGYLILNPRMRTA